MDKGLQELLDREAIRDLVLCYSRAVDRQDFELLRDLYTEDATDTHGDAFDGPAEDYLKFLEDSLPRVFYTGHHVCNHMVSIAGNEANGEVYGLSLHVIPNSDGSDGRTENFFAVRYIDNYRRCADGKWRFSKRVIVNDMQIQRPFTGDGQIGVGAADPSYAVCSHRRFQRGPREAVSAA